MALCCLAFFSKNDIRTDFNVCYGFVSVMFTEKVESHDLC